MKFQANLNAGYAVWYHRYNTNMVCTGSIYLLIMCLWAFAPLVVNEIGSAQFLVLLDLLAYASSTIAGLIFALVDVFTSGSMIMEIAELLNLPSSDLQGLLYEEELAGKSRNWVRSRLAPC